jgi:hypothetical protein
MSDHVRHLGTLSLFSGHAISPRTLRAPLCRQSAQYPRQKVSHLGRIMSRASLPVDRHAIRPGILKH